MSEHIIRFAQRATIEPLASRERKHRMKNNEDHHARAMDFLTDLQQPHVLSMELSVRLPKSLTDDERKECEAIVGRAWEDMFFGIMRATSNIQPREGEGR